MHFKKHYDFKIHQSCPGQDKGSQLFTKALENWAQSLKTCGTNIVSCGGVGGGEVGGRGSAGEVKFLLNPLRVYVWA